MRKKNTWSSVQAGGGRGQVMESQREEGENEAKERKMQGGEMK